MGLPKREEIKLKREFEVYTEEELKRRLVWKRVASNLEFQIPEGLSWDKNYSVGLPGAELRPREVIQTIPRGTV